VLDAGSNMEMKTITVTSDTPGAVAEIRASATPSRGFKRVASSKTLGGSTTFDLDGAEARYYLVWITKVTSGESGYAHVNEVKAAA